MTMPTDENRLGDGHGPYLRRLAADPINWQPWDEQALEAARARDVPIFLSVGYAGCPECHRMQAESFHDEEVVALLNEEFVPVAVDRDRRPDVDLVYQTVCRLVEDAGGWPLSAWLTPEGKPFYVGTYFPPEHTDYAPGFPDLLELIAEKWTSPVVREEIENRAAEWTEQVAGALDAPLGRRGRHSTVGRGTAWRPTVEHVAELAVRGADHVYGGWGTGAKFPEPARIELLLTAAVLTGDDRARSVATTTLDAMTTGALQDHFGGGVFRYCVDREWSDPHVEKPLAVNAETARAFLAGYQVDGKRGYATAARRTFAFLDRVLSDPDGAFYAGLGVGPATPDFRTDDDQPPEAQTDDRPADARTDDGQFDEVAATYYGWTPDEIDAALDDPDLARLARARYGISGEHGGDAPTVPKIAASIEDLAAASGCSVEETRERLDRVRHRLRQVRGRRPARFRDERVFAGWNGLAIQALADGALVFEDDTLAERATDALDAVRDRLWEGDRLVGRYVDDGSARSTAFLDDYAFLGRGALACYEATGDAERLGFALDLGRAIVDVFFDDGRLPLAPVDQSGDLPVNPQHTRDLDVPGSIPVAVELLASLDRFAPKRGFSEVTERVLDTYAPRVHADALAHHSLALAGDRVRSGPTEVTFPADAVSGAWRRWLAERYLPHRLLTPRPAGDLATWLDSLGLDEVPPIWTRDSSDDPVVFLRRDGDCSGPLSDPTSADEWLDG